MSALKPFVVCAMLGAGLGFIGGAVGAAGVHICAPSAVPVPAGGPLVVAGGWAVCGTAAGLVGGLFVGAIIALVSAVIGAAKGRGKAVRR
jgi:hypothetical protein